MERNTARCPCETKKTDGNGSIEPENLKKPENKHKVRSAIALLVIAAVAVVVFFTTSPTIGLPPVDPGSFGFSISIGILVGAAIAILFLVVYVGKKTTEKKGKT